MKFVTLNMVERGAFDEDTGTYGEGSKPTIVNASCIRCFYSRKDGKPGTRITFNDGGGFAVTELVDAVALAVAGGEVAAQLTVAHEAAVA
jgi:hypothetical protein